MKVLLVIPQRPTAQYLPAPDIGLAYVARAALDVGTKVQVLDAHLSRISPAQFKEWLDDRVFDVVGFKCLSMDLPNVLRYAAIVRELLPQAAIVLGGPHPSALPDFTLRHSCIDFVIVGEGELPFSALLNSMKTHGRIPPDHELAGIPSLTWREGSSGRIRSNPVRFAENLDSLGSPAWELFDIPRYPVLPGSGGTTLPILTTRGCPADCLFCTAGLLHGRTIRSRSLDSVFNEIAWLTRTYGLSKVSIFDDNFSGSRQRVLEFCRRFRDERPAPAFDIPQGIRIDGLDQETVCALEKTGCRSIGVGVESGSDETLSLMHKGLSTSFIANQLDLLRRHSSMEIMGFFILGFPHETPAMIRQTVEFSLRLPLDTAAFTLFTPFPGTPEFDSLRRRKIIDLDSIPWQDLSLDKAVFPHPTIARERLKKFQTFAYLRFYFRPSRYSFFKRILLENSFLSYARRFTGILGLDTRDGD